MSNMSYCRFRNTLSDLQDCEEALEEVGIPSDDALSTEEARAAVQLVETCFRIARVFADKPITIPTKADIREALNLPTTNNDD